MITRFSLPSLNSNCFQHGYPEECQQKLNNLYVLLQQQTSLFEQSDEIPLVGLYKLLKQWRMEIPFSILALLMRKANQFAHQTNQSLNELAFHQFIHNPEIQSLYRRKPSLKANLRTDNGEYMQNCSFSTPQTLISLFNRLSELIQRKELYGKVQDDSVNMKEKYNYMMQMMTVGSQEQKIFPTSITKQESILFEDEETILESVVQEAKRQGLSQAQKDKKFIQIASSTPTFQMNSRMRRVHSNMIKQMQFLKQDNNVQKLQNLIRKSQGLQLRLPEL
ncbi:hypothetical protein pb186bvf_000817 [Paramecium bursaria]